MVFYLFRLAHDFGGAFGGFPAFACLMQLHRSAALRPAAVKLSCGGSVPLLAKSMIRFRCLHNLTGYRSPCGQEQSHTVPVPPCRILRPSLRISYASPGNKAPSGPFSPEGPAIQVPIFTSAFGRWRAARPQKPFRRPLPKERRPPWRPVRRTRGISSAGFPPTWQPEPAAGS